MDICLIFSPVITVAIAAAKRIPFVGNNPKIVATVLAAGLAAVSAWYGGHVPTVAQLATCIAQGLAGAVATHEVVVKPVLDTVAIGDAR